jgi:hypothetical protein
MRPVRRGALDQERSTISCQIGGRSLLFFRRSTGSTGASLGRGATRALAPGRKMARRKSNSNHLLLRGAAQRPRRTFRETQQTFLLSGRLRFPSRRPFCGLLDARGPGWVQLNFHTQGALTMAQKWRRKPLKSLKTDSAIGEPPARDCEGSRPQFRGTYSARKSGGTASLASASSASSAPSAFCALEPRRRTDTVSSLASLRPRAIRTGTFAKECSRTL